MAVLVITHIAEIFYHCHRIEGSDIAKEFLNVSANLFSIVFIHRCGAVAVTGADGAFVQTSFAMTLTSRFSRRSICV